VTDSNLLLLCGHQEWLDVGVEDLGAGGPILSHVSPLVDVEMLLFSFESGATVVHGLLDWGVLAVIRGGLGRLLGWLTYLDVKLTLLASGARTQTTILCLDLFSLFHKNKL
jgi:hypothetical protein